MTQAVEPTDAGERRFSFSRRSMLGVGIGGAAALAMTRSARGAPVQTTAPPVVPTLRFLLDRITYGFDANMAQRAHMLGYQAFLEEQLHPESIPDVRVGLMLAPFTTLAMSGKQIHDQFVAQGQAIVPMTELKTAAILRASFSNRQLFERMVEFWTDHFNIDHSDGQANALKSVDDREVIRKYALGTFPELLEASARSGAMLYYLGNYRNTLNSPNENYAREIMELHSLGVGNFSEFDVREVTRCLTGWGHKQPQDANYGQFHFNPANHDFGSKIVLGSVIPSGGGVTDGTKVVRTLALHPKTAEFISRKLCRWFLSYEPPQDLVESIARTYLATFGDIKAMLRKLFDPTSLSHVSSDTIVKIRRPFHLVASVARASKIELQQPVALVTELQRLGQQPFGWVPPNGYPDNFKSWGSGLQARWSFLSRLFSNQIPGITINASSMFGATPKDQLAGRANLALSGGRLTYEDQAAIQDYANSFPTLTDALRREVLTLTASCPSFQTY